MLEHLWARFLVFVRTHTPAYDGLGDYAKLYVLPFLAVLILQSTLMLPLQRGVLLGFWHLADLWSLPVGASSAFLLWLLYRLPHLAAELLALLPWLWLASVLMVNWLQARPTVPGEDRPKAVIWQSPVLRLTATMFGLCLLIAPLVDLPLQWLNYVDEINENFTHHVGIGTIGLTLGVMHLVLVRHCRSLHDLATGRQIDLRGRRMRLGARIAPLFFMPLVIGGITHQLSGATTDHGGWGTGPLRIERADAPADANAGLASIDVGIVSLTSRDDPLELIAAGATPPARARYVLDRAYVYELMIFAITVLILSEMMARTVSTDRTGDIRTPGRASRATA